MTAAHGSMTPHPGVTATRPHSTPLQRAMTSYFLHVPAVRLGRGGSALGWLPPLTQQEGCWSGGSPHIGSVGDSRDWIGFRASEESSTGSCTRAHHKTRVLKEATLRTALLDTPCHTLMGRGSWQTAQGHTASRPHPLCEGVDDQHRAQPPRAGPDGGRHGGARHQGGCGVGGHRQGRPGVEACMPQGQAVTRRRGK
jgi:hypothetical protein